MSWAYASSAGTLLLVSVLTHPSGGDPAGLVGVLNHLASGEIGEEERRRDDADPHTSLLCAWEPLVSWIGHLGKSQVR